MILSKYTLNRLHISKKLTNLQKRFICFIKRYVNIFTCHEFDETFSFLKLNTAASDIKKDSLEPEIEDDNISSVDLTGNPLNIDLNADMSLLPLEEHIWSPQENNHYPLPLNIAR